MNFNEETKHEAGGTRVIRLLIWTGKSVITSACDWRLKTSPSDDIVANVLAENNQKDFRWEL